MINKEEIESILSGQEFSEYKWINPQDIIVAQWVRVKCTFGCNDYGLGTCPPNTPSVQDCQRFFNEYKSGIVIRLTKFTDKNNYASEWSKSMTNRLLDTEKQLFLKGYHKAFLLNQTCCGICNECTGNRIDCKDKKHSRPSPEAFAVDVYQTVRNVGMNVNVIAKTPSEINRYAFILLE